MVVAGIAFELSFHHISTGIQNAHDVEQKRQIANIQGAAAWRKISNDQRGKFLSAIGPLCPDRLMLATATNDPEAVNLSREFDELFREANCPISGHAGMGALPNAYGIFVGTDEKLEPVRAAFKAAGIEFSSDVPKNIGPFDPAMLVVVAGKRPEFWRANAN